MSLFIKLEVYKMIVIKTCQGKVVYFRCNAVRLSFCAVNIFFVVVCLFKYYIRRVAVDRLLFYFQSLVGLGYAFKIIFFLNLTFSYDI